jgi:hypothetical protein
MTWTAWNSLERMILRRLTREYFLLDEGSHDD